MDIPMCKRCITDYRLELPELWQVGVCACCNQMKIVYDITYDYIDRINEEAEDE
jgi:hypothetical protein